MAYWIAESLSPSERGSVSLSELIPRGYAAYARVFHPACLDGAPGQGVRWSSVASWTGRTVHPAMQFARIAGLSGDPNEDPPWGRLPERGSIPEKECRTLASVLQGFTSTPYRCFFCLWDGYGNIDRRLLRVADRVRTPGRTYLLFRGPLPAVTSFLDDRMDWGDSPNIWWPEDRAWCVSTDIDLYSTYVGGSLECIKDIVSNPDLEALSTSIDARVDLDGDLVNEVLGKEK